MILTFRMYNKSNVVEIYDNHTYLFLQIVRCQSVAGFIELRVFPRDKLRVLINFWHLIKISYLVLEWPRPVRDIACRTAHQSIFPMCPSHDPTHRSERTVQ